MGSERGIYGNGTGYLGEMEEVFRGGGGGGGGGIYRECGQCI